MQEDKITAGTGNPPQMQRRQEEYAIVLDFLLNGYPFDARPMFRKTPIVQAVGKITLALLELVPKKDIFLQPHDEVYIGDGKRDKIHHIVGRIKFENLTASAYKELEFIVIEYVKKEEAKFVNFFNTSEPLTTRMHRLELLSGLGKKKMWEIVEERQVKPFKSFEDLRKRIPLMPDPVKLIAKRIMAELTGKEKHYLFVQN
jgi:putative nucleotide binding protein